MTSAGSMRVLAVDDDPVSRRLLLAALRKFGCEPLEAADGAQALAFLESGECRIVVTDWMMPGVDGLELCRRIREVRDRRYVYVIVLTSRTEPGSAAIALEQGADEFLAKPLDPVELRARLGTARRILELESALAGRLQELERTLALLREREARLLEAERLAAVGALGLAVRREIDGPLAGLGEILERLLGERERLPGRVLETLESARGLARRIGSIAAKLEAIRSAETTDYLPGAPMLDLEASSRPPGP